MHDSMQCFAFGAFKCHRWTPCLILLDPWDESHLTLSWLLNLRLCLVCPDHQSNGDGETSKRKAFTEINRGSLTGPIGTRLPMAKSEEPGDPGQGKLPEGLAVPLKMPATSPSSTPGRAGSPWARRLTIAGLFLLVLLLLAIGLAWVWVRHLLRKPAQAIRHDPGFGSAREDPDRPRRAGNPHDPGGVPR